MKIKAKIPAFASVLSEDDIRYYDTEAKAKARLTYTGFSIDRPRGGKVLKYDKSSGCYEDYYEWYPRINCLICGIDCVHSYIILNPKSKATEYKYVHSDCWRDKYWKWCVTCQIKHHPTGDAKELALKDLGL